MRLLFAYNKNINLPIIADKRSLSASSLYFFSSPGTQDNDELIYFLTAYVSYMYCDSAQNNTTI